MITVILGENLYERDHQLRQLGLSNVSTHDGTDMTVNQFSQLAFGLSLFESSEGVIIKGLSDNKDVWDFLGEQIKANNQQFVNLILLETKPDKRTKTFMALKKIAKIIECKPFGVRDQSKASVWLVEYASSQKIKLLPKVASEIVNRIGLNQYALINELSRLAVMGEITLNLVKDYTPPAPKDTALTLLSLALKGDVKSLQTAIDEAKLTADPYMTLGLLASQVYAISGLVLADDITDSEVARRLGINPFILRNFKAAARHINKSQLSKIIAEVAQIDTQIKTMGIEPWLAIQSGLVMICQQFATCK